MHGSHRVKTLIATTERCARMAADLRNDAMRLGSSRFAPGSTKENERLARIQALERAACVYDLLAQERLAVDQK
jgi:RecB family exonuclease